MKNSLWLRFWYNSGVLKKGRAAILFSFLGVAAFGQNPAPPLPDFGSFFEGLRQSFDAGNRAAFLDVFAEEIRSKEGDLFDTLRQTFLLTRASFHTASRIIEGETASLFVQTLFQNETEALFETWKLGLIRKDERWIIRSKEINGTPSVLYNLQIPSGRVEKVSRIEIRHTDLTVTFEDAWVYYDNLPRQETGLIIMGPGRVRFSPSTPTERHQLDLRYKTGILETNLVSAYLRFSPSFFESNIKITRPEGSFTAIPPPAETARAKNLFARHYANSFTIENSLNGEELSFIPQGEQVVFELGTDERRGFGYVYSPFSDEEVHFYSRTPDQLICLYSPVVTGDTGRRMFISFDEKFDVLRCDVDLDFQPLRFFISAKARVEVSARVQDVDSLKFDFNPALDILRVYDQAGRELFYTQDKSRQLLYIFLLQPLEKGQQASVEVFYRGALEPPIQTTDVISGGQFDSQISLIPPNYDSYLYSRSALWYPAPSEQDYFHSRLRISIPPDYVCVANGELTEEVMVDEVGRVFTLEKIGNRISIFESRKPLKYLSFIVGKFNRTYTENPAGSPLLRIHVSEDVRGTRKNALEDARAIINVYESVFGPFPYEKLSIVQRVWPTIGGHSPASFLVLNELSKNHVALQISDPQSPVDLPRYKEYILAHEIAHQWWGQALSGATYHDQWLSEGLAQYAAVRFLKTRYGEKSLPSILNKYVEWTEKKSNIGPITLGFRLSLFDFKGYQAVLYGKTCVALFLLSDLIGEETFDRGLRTFFEAQSFKPARTNDFIKAMETASGRPLGEFFRVWFETHELPRAAVTTEVTNSGDGYELRIQVRQAQNPMVFPLHVSWMEGGRAVRQILDVDSPTKTFTFRTSAKPTKFKVNPDRLVPGIFD
jgi:hypothetical protein